MKAALLERRMKEFEHAMLKDLKKQVIFYKKQVKERVKHISNREGIIDNNLKFKDINLKNLDTSARQLVIDEFYPKMMEHLTKAIKKVDPKKYEGLKKEHLEDFIKINPTLLGSKNAGVVYDTVDELLGNVLKEIVEDSKGNKLSTMLLTTAKGLAYLLVAILIIASVGVGITMAAPYVMTALSLPTIALPALTLSPYLSMPIATYALSALSGSIGLGIMTSFALSGPDKYEKMISGYNFMLLNESLNFFKEFEPHYTILTTEQDTSKLPPDKQESGKSSTYDVDDRTYVYETKGRY